MLKQCMVTYSKPILACSFFIRAKTQMDIERKFGWTEETKLAEGPKGQTRCRINLAPK